MATTSRLSTRDRIIRGLRPFVMRSTGLSQDDATEFLVKLSEDERMAIWKLRQAPYMSRAQAARRSQQRPLRVRSASPRVGGVGARGTYVPLVSPS